MQPNKEIVDTWWESTRRCPKCTDYRLMTTNGKIYACTHCGHIENTREDYKPKRKEDK